MKNPKIVFGSVLLALACFAVPSAVLAAPRPTSTPTPTVASENCGGGKIAAERVEALNLNTMGLNRRDEQITVNTLRYEQINAMLLNELLKEYKAFVVEQEKVKKLETGLAGLLATVEEQAAQIEKASAQVQVRQPRMSLARINP